jgi:hypothetical protein
MRALGSVHVCLHLGLRLRVGIHNLRGWISFCEDVVEFNGEASSHGQATNNTVAVKMKHLSRFYADFPIMEKPKSTAQIYERDNGLSSGRALIVGQQ